MFRIRRFRASDTKEVTRVITSGLKQLFNCRKIDLGEELIDDLSDIHRNYIARGGAFYVGEYDGRVIGTVAVLPAGRNAARLKRMYLYRTYRRRGFGSRLYDAAESWCKRRGYSRMLLSTHPRFAEAIAFYERKGYKFLRRTEKQLFFSKDI